MAYIHIYKKTIKKNNDILKAVQCNLVACFHLIDIVHANDLNAKKISKFFFVRNFSGFSVFDNTILWYWTLEGEV